MKNLRSQLTVTLKDMIQNEDTRVLEHAEVSVVKILKYQMHRQQHTEYKKTGSLKCHTRMLQEEKGTQEDLGVDRKINLTLQSSEQTSKHRYHVEEQDEKMIATVRKWSVPDHLAASQPAVVLAPINGALHRSRARNHLHHDTCVILFQEKTTTTSSAKVLQLLSN